MALSLGLNANLDISLCSCSGISLCVSLTSKSIEGSSFLIERQARGVRKGSEMCHRLGSKTCEGIDGVAAFIVDFVSKDKAAEGDNCFFGYMWGHSYCILGTEC